MGKASRRKRQQAASTVVDLLAVHAAGTCIHCRRRPRATPAVWCQQCVLTARGMGSLNYQPPALTFNRHGNIVHLDRDRAGDLLQPLHDLLTALDHDHDTKENP